MRRATLLIALAGVVALGVAAPANASSGYSGCNSGVSGEGQSAYTRSGYIVPMTNYRGRGMACSSVRYVINKWLRPKVSRQYGYPRLARPFYDGWVTWHCWKPGGYVVQCDEYKSGTSFRFNGRVY